MSNQNHRRRRAFAVSMQSEKKAWPCILHSHRQLSESQISGTHTYLDLTCKGPHKAWLEIWSRKHKNRGKLWFCAPERADFSAFIIFHRATGNNARMTALPGHFFIGSRQTLLDSYMQGWMPALARKCRCFPKTWRITWRWIAVRLKSIIGKHVPLFSFHMAEGSSHEQKPYMTRKIKAPLTLRLHWNCRQYTSVVLWSKLA